MSTNDAKLVVLRTKEIMGEMGATRCTREEFVDVCTKASRSFIAKRRGRFVTPLSAFDEELLKRLVLIELEQRGLLEAQGIPGFSSAGNGLEEASPDRGASGSPGRSPSRDPLKPMVLQPIKVTVVTEVKRMLDPPFKARDLGRENYSTLALQITKMFFETFPIENVPNAQLGDADYHWLAAATNAELRKLGIASTAFPSAAATASSRDVSPPKRSASEGRDVSPNPAVQIPSLNLSSAVPAADSDSAFDSEMKKLHGYLDQHSGVNLSSETPGVASAPGADDATRQQLLMELQMLLADQARIQRAIHTKVEQLAQLN